MAKKSTNIVIDSAMVYYGTFDMKNLDTLISSLDTQEIGYTKEAISFEATPEIRDIEHNGSMERKVKGMQRITRWDVKVTCNALEVSEKTLTTSLMKKETPSDVTTTKYDVYIPKSDIEDEDYKDLLIVGKKKGTTDPIIVQVFNTFNAGGLKFEQEDNNEASMEMEFNGSYDGETIPFRIYNPKEAVS